MSPTIIAGIVIVNLALICYAIGVVGEQRSRRISSRVVAFLAAGVAFDVIATAFMIAGSSGSIFSLHGVIGLSSLAAMALETLFAWRHRARSGDAPVAAWLHQYGRYAFGWWIVAYVIGAGMAMAAA